MHLISRLLKTTFSVVKQAETALQSVAEYACRLYYYYKDDVCLLKVEWVSELHELQGGYLIVYLLLNSICAANITNLLIFL